eukprot:TRINITY_DN23343_c0_g1_i1.p1 TRINITY_DN23343_c0_g1~~TRINITY_DN23343_c0_g1_i1.p1  ORF type:complete len:641 (-),score=107.15 TRINITY_DN23343_c0_g1_i1:32-1738(-)
MPSLGLQLCFDSFQQDLRVITVRLQASDDAVAVGSEAEEEDRDAPEANLLPPLAYNGRVFAGATGPSARAPPCIREVYNMFGPTWIGDFRPEGRPAYLLRYPGLAFEFPLPEDLVDGLAAKGEHPTEIPGRPPATACRLWVYASDSPTFLSPASVMPDMPEAVVVRPSLGVELQGRLLRFGAMPQDIFSDFGPPEQVCVKEFDAVRIHSARVPTSKTAGPDYYYNYFHLGVDVLFDGRTHLVKKVTLHANPPTHERFSRYSRCFFQLPLVQDEEQAAAAAAGDALMAEEEELLPAASEHQEEELLPVPAASEPQEASEVQRDRETLLPDETSIQEPADEATDHRKKNRKSQKKSKKSRAGRAPLGSPVLGSESSPSLSVLSTSPEPSPILAKIKESTNCRSGRSLAGSPAAGPAGVGDAPEGLDVMADMDELLPPPALPLDGLDAEENSSTKLFGNAQDSNICIDVRWSWPDVEEVLHRVAGFPRSKPLVMSQSGHTPFGSTYFYAFPGLIFEVMQNGYVASLTVFSVPPGELPSVFQHRGSSGSASAVPPSSGGLIEAEPCDRDWQG